ncbi:MAG: 16S rRNA (guanine(527)-N(7))-methyltransferase RsmG [Scrofimicrobium sp.]
MVLSSFGPNRKNVIRFANMLAEEGEVRGLIGPRESERLWSRHIVNSSALLPFLPTSGTVADVGSGAGLPGLVIACARPDLSVKLIEPMERRCEWLQYVVDTIDLSNVEVIRERSESLGRSVKADVVTARAVAALSKLVRLTSKLIAPGGALLALKGQRAYQEVEEAELELKKYHLNAEVHEVVSVMDGDITYVVECRRHL